MFELALLPSPSPQTHSSLENDQPHTTMGLPRGLSDRDLPANAGNTGLISGLGRFPGVGNGNPLQYSCLANPMDRGDWQATVYGVIKEWDMT